jgi:hypothetical protein
MPDDTRKSLKDFLTSTDYTNTVGNVTDKNKISLSSLASDPDAGEVAAAVPLLNADVDNGSWALLGDYVNYISKHFYKDSGNEFFIEGGERHAAAAATVRGESIPAYTNRQGAESTFIYRKSYNEDGVGTDIPSDLGLTLADYSNSGKWDTTEDTNVIGRLIDKTGNITSGAPNGNHIYDNIPVGGYIASTAVGEDMAEPVKSSFAMLQEHNRFSVKEGNEYGYKNVQDKTAGSPNQKPFTTVQDEKGKYDTSGVGVKFSKLKDVGLAILMNAATFPDSVNVVDEAQATQESVSPGKTDEGEIFGANSGAFEKVQQSKKIKTSFSSPDNKFTDKSRDSGHTGYFKEIIDKFFAIIDYDEAAGYLKGITTDAIRENNSVYTANSYQECINKAIEQYFTNAPETGNSPRVDHFKDPFFVNIAASLTKIINAEADANTPGEARKDSMLATEKRAMKKFLDTMAVVGDIMLELETKNSGDAPDAPLPGGGGRKLVSSGKMWDVDSLKAGPATRISKSKTSDVDRTLAWNSRATPAIYHLPSTIIRSMQNMGAVNGQNPMKGMLTTDLVNKTYMSAGFTPLEGSNFKNVMSDLGDQLLAEAKTTYRVPKMLAEKIENKLDAEYVPFYFHDLRTNEIISFHAFLSDLTDSFKADYESNAGFGRMDPVRIYNNTTRDIGFSFKIVATSEQDFDEMWFKINKLITLLYPQWSAGEQLNAKQSSFTRPFSQVPVGSPMIRLRIGDVVKSNYSRFNLSRIFGSGKASTVIHPADVNTTSLLGMLSEAIAKIPFMKGTDLNAEIQEIQDKVSRVMLKAMLMLIGSPLQYLELIPDNTMLGIIAKDILFDVFSNGLDKDGRGGFMSPLLGDLFDRLRHPDSSHETTGLSNMLGARIGDAVMLKPSMEKHYISPKYSGGNVNDVIPFIGFPPGIDEHPPAHGIADYIVPFEKIRTTRHVKCRVVGIKKLGNPKVTHYNVVAVQTETSSNPDVEIEGRMFTVTYDDFVFDPDYLFGRNLGMLLDPISGIMDKVQDLIDMVAGSIGISTDNINLYTTTFEDFMHPVNNSITKSFETTSGRGLAGFISSISFKWIDNDIPWETKFGGRAPKVCDVSVKFDPVHDIAPGLDKAGFNRAPTHNVGSIMNNMAGDPFEKGHDAAKKSFDKAMNDAAAYKYDGLGGD